MNPLEKGYPPQKIIQVKKALSWKPNVLNLVGTGGLKAQQNFAADYDFVSKVAKWTEDSAFDSIQQILQNIDEVPYLFFIELKIQNKDGSKVKMFKIEDFNKESFQVAFDEENVDYVKIDGVVDLDGVFKEVSALYFLSKTPLDNKKYQLELLKDAKEKFDDGKPYKALKRMFMAEKLQDRLGGTVDMELIRKITDFFNTEIGKLYEKMNQIDAALIFHDKYNGPNDQRRLDRFISNIGLSGINVLQLPQVSKEYNKIIQREALKFFKKYKLTPGVLPGGMSGGFLPSLLFGIAKDIGKFGLQQGAKQLEKGLNSDNFKTAMAMAADQSVKKMEKRQKRDAKAAAEAAAPVAAAAGGKRKCGGGPSFSRPRDEFFITPKEIQKIIKKTSSTKIKPHELSAFSKRMEKILKPFHGFQQDKRYHLRDAAIEIALKMASDGKIKLSPEGQVIEILDDSPFPLSPEEDSYTYAAAEHPNFYARTSRA